MKFNEEDWLVKEEDGTTFCSLSPRTPNIRGVRTRKSNGYLIAKVKELRDLLTLYVEHETKKIKSSELKGIAYKETEHFKKSEKLINYLKENKGTIFNK
jgi:hypothetical protein